MAVEQKKYHLISVLMENKPGALSRLTGLFSARNFNIDSLTVAPTSDPTLSRTTVSIMITDRLCDQLIKQLNKLVDVVKVVDISEAEAGYIERDLLVIKLDVAKQENRIEITNLLNIFGGKVINVTEGSYIAELCGSVPRIDSFLANLNDSWILETVRSGPLGLIKGLRLMGINKV